MFFRSILKLASATLLSQIIIVASIPLLVMIYTPESFAVYAIYIALVNVLASAACLRLEHAIVVAKKHHVESLLSLTLTLSTVSTVLSIFIVLLVSKFGLSELINDSPGLYLVCVPLGVLLTAFWNINYSVANREELYNRIAKAQVFKNLMLVLIQLVVGYLSSMNSYVMVFSHLASLLLGNLLLRTPWCGNLSMKRYRAVFRVYINFPKYSAPSILLNTLGKSSIPFFVGAVGGSTVLGYYAFLERFLAAPSAILGGAVGRVYYRSAAKLVGFKSQALQLFDRTVMILFIISAFIFFSVYAFPFERLDEYLKPEWRGVYHLLPLLIPVFFIKFIVIPVSMVTNVYGEQKASLIWNVLFSVVLNLSFILVLFYEYSYVILLNVYVGISILFYLFCYVMLRGFISKGGGGD